MTTQTHSGPLAGIRVVDLSIVISGPVAAMMLGDQGADVIKVEAPGLGDPLRMFGAMRGGMASSFVNCNRSKRAVALNLRGEEGREVLRKLVADADVFIQNFRPGAIERLGFDYDTVRAIAPDIIYVSIFGFGETGPLAGRPVYDNVIQGISGVAAVQADPETGRPELVRNLSLDKATAYTVAQAVTAALFARERGHGGQHIRVSMLDVALAFLWPDGMMNHTFLGDDVMQVPPFSTVYRVYPTADGAMTVAPLTDDQWANWCRAVEREDLLEDPDLATTFDRLRNMDQMADVVREMQAQRTTAEWCARYEQHDVPHGPVVGLDDVPHHPQVQANGVLVETEHPHAGRMREPLPAAKFGATPAAPHHPAPLAGEHTDAVLAELGYTAEQIAQLRDAGAVA